MTETGTPRPFAVFDIDGTLIRWQLYHAVADLLLSAKPDSEAAKAYKRVQEAFIQWKQRAHEESFRDYEMKLVQAYENIMRDLSVDEFHVAADTVFQEYRDQVYRYTRKLIHELKEQGYLIFSISGSDDVLIGKMADYYGFDDYVGVRRAHAHGRFTGEVEATWGRKAEILKELVKKHNTSFEGSIGVGDSEGDIDMLNLVERPVAFNPSKKLFEHASNKGWKVVVERKNLAYELEQRDGIYVLAQASC